MARDERLAEATQAALRGRSVINVNSTAVGGGVAEMPQTLPADARGPGIDARWLVIRGDPELFAITKRIHNGLYGSPGDGGPLGEGERPHDEAVLRRGAHELRATTRAGDVVILHDPQPAGPAAALRADGARVIWRSHVAATPRTSGPSGRGPSCGRPWSRLALADVGLLGGEREVPVVPFARRDGSPGRLDRRVDVLQTGPPPPPDAPLVVQVSRWDAMKDMAGVMRAFAEHVDPALGAHLALSGPAVRGVADDPEAAGVLADWVARWRELPHALRARVHLSCVPMDDPDEAAAIANALQRHAAVVVRKSLAEGFGLTVAEAILKARPIVAGAVGGIVDQIDDGEHGLLVRDPRDPAAAGAAIERLLRDPDEAGAMGARARRRAIDEFLGDRHLGRYARLFAALS